jgi:hypothetical protein
MVFMKPSDQKYRALGEGQSGLFEKLPKVMRLAMQI